MQLRKEVKFIFAILLISLIFISSLFFVVEAGSLTPSGPVGSTMHSLQEIYDLIAGTFDSNAFTGSGLDDMTPGGTFTGALALNYRVQIDAEGTPDTFAWSDNGGATWDAAGVAITGLAQTLNNGVAVTFGATTGHTLGNRWDFSTNSLANIDGNVIQQLKYISENLGGSSIVTLQDAYNNSSPATITTADNKDMNFTLANTATDSNFKINIASGSTGLFQITDSASTVFSIDNAGNIIMGAPALTSADSARISSGGASDLALNAGSGKIKAATGSTFYNENGYAIAVSGEEILRASIQIYGYDFPARTSNSAVSFKISRDITLEADSFPAVPAGADRIYKFKIQYANDVINANASSWEVYTLPGPVLFTTLNPVPNTGIANLDEAVVYYSESIAALPAVGQKWYLQVAAPASTTIQIYQIELLAYDVLQ